MLAHELGHFKHRHIVKRIVSMFAMSLAGFALLGWLAQQVWFYTGLGVMPNVAAPNDALALLLFMLAMPVFSFFVAPLFAPVSYTHLDVSKRPRKLPPKSALALGARQ